MLSFCTVYCTGYRSIAGDVEGSTEHIQYAVNAGYKGNAFQRQIGGLKYHGQHDEAAARNTSCTDGGQGTGEHNHNHLIDGEVNAIYISYKQCAYTHVYCSTIHIDSSAQWKDEGNHFLLNLQLFNQILHIDRQCTGGGTGGKSNHHSFGHSPVEISDLDLPNQRHNRCIYQKHMSHGTDSCRNDD